jgi:hypothetical protein
MTKTPKIFSDEFKNYQQKAVRGIYVNTHSQFFKVSPANYTGIQVEAGETIDKDRIYNAIVSARAEAVEKGLSGVHLPIGLDTHNIKFSVNGTQCDIYLDVGNPLVKLDAFQKLIAESNGRTQFPIGRLPYHNDKVYRTLVSDLNIEHTARISSLFFRPRDQKPRVYVTVTYSEMLFGITSTPHLDIDFDDIVVPSKSFTPDLDIDL